MWTAARAGQDLFTDNNNTQCSKQMMNITMWTLSHYHIMICNNMQTDTNRLESNQIWHDLVLEII